MTDPDPRPYLTGMLDQLAAANAAGDTAAAETILARLITDNDPAARTVVADALRLRAARDRTPQTQPPTNSTPDTP
jgi:hypothetical protein